METITKPAEDKAEPKQEESKTFEMPVLDKPQSFFNEKTGDFWVGLPVGRIDYITCSALLDRCKLDVLVIFQQIAARQKLIKPDGNKYGNFVRGLFKR